MKKKVLLPLLTILILASSFTLFPSALEAVGDGILPSRGTAAEDYDALYVQGYTTKWDGFDLTEGGAVNTDIFGEDAVAGYGSLNVQGATLDLSALLPYDRTQSTPELDFTLDATVALRESTFSPDNSACRLHVGAYGGYNGAGYGVQVFLKTTISSYPADESFGQISGTYAAYTNPSGGTAQFSTDTSEKNRFLGALRGEIYTFAVAVDYDIPASKASIRLLRDGDVATSGTVAYPIANGTKLGYTDRITVPSALQFDYYALRIYPFALTEAQLRQNHFADLSKWFGVCLDAYKSYDEQTKTALHEAVKDESFETITRAELQSLIDGFATFDEAFSASSVLTFEGFQGKLWSVPGIRSIYTVDLGAIKQLEQKGYTVTVGALMAIADGRDASVITLGSASSSQTVVYKNGEITAEKTLSRTDDAFSFGYATVFKDKESSYDEKLLYRGYVTLEKGDERATFYLDTETELLSGSALSLFELYTLLSFLGYEEYPAIYGVMPASVSAAAGALKADFAKLYGAKAEMRALSDGLALYTRYALLIRAGALGKNKAYEKLDAELSYNETLDALIECENAILAVKLCQDQITRLQGQALSLQARFEEEAALYAAIAQSCGEYAERVSAVLACPIGLSKTVIRTLIADFSIQKTAIDRIYDGTQTHREKIASVKARVLTVRDPNAFGTDVKLSSYVILTERENEVTARLLQAMLAKTYGVILPYVYGLPKTLAAKHAIYLQCDKEPGDADYVISAEGGNAYLLGSSSDNVRLAAAIFARACTEESLTLTPTVGKHIAPLFDTALPSVLDALSLASLEDGGVYQRFTIVSASFGDELAVIEPLSSSDFPLSAEHTYFVSPTGIDSGSGTKRNPFKTLSRALSEALAMGGAQIVLRGGRYEITETVQIGTLHGGTKQSPLYITAYPGETVTFTAADTVSGASFTRVSEQSVIDRLNTFIDGNAENVYVSDLSALGITDYPAPSTAGEPVLLRGNVGLHLARYPNAGEKPSDGRTPLYTGAGDIIKQCKVSNVGSALYEQYKNETDDWKMRASAEFRTHAMRWQSENVWLFGAVHEEWWRKHMPVTFAYETIDGEDRVFTMSSTVRCDWGLQYKKNNDGYFYNVLEELDADGEWYLDTERGLLYVYASGGIGKDESFVLSGRETTLLSVKNTESVVINGITFAETLSSAVEVENSEYVLFQNCVFRDTRRYGLLTTDVRNVGVITSRFERIGNTAVFMRGKDDQSSMTPDRNVIQNCTFLSCDVILQGIASLVSHNLFDRTNLQCSAAVESVIEYNEFHRGPQSALDAGPIYCAGSSFGGNHIRYNYIHDLDHSIYGIYLDSFSCGVYVYSNIITYAEGHTGRCVNVHGGGMHVIRANVCVGGGSETYAAINESANFYVQKITEDGVRRQCDIIRMIGGTVTAFKTTDTGWVGSVWLTSLKRRYEAYLAIGGASSRYAERFPHASLYAELLGICLADIKAQGDDYDAYSAAWTHKDGDPAFGEEGFYAWLTSDGHEGDLEIFLRSTLGTTIDSNIFIGCAMDVQKVTDYGVASSTLSGNYSLSSDSDYYAEVRNGDLSAFSNASVWQSLVPDFTPIKIERLGVLETKDATIALPNNSTPNDEDTDINVGFGDLFG